MLSDHAVSILIFAGIDVIMALSFFLPASAGQLSAGQGGFMALGAYTSAYLSVHHQTPFPLALAAGGLVGGLVGLAVGFPALRLRGLYLVLVTFGFGEMVRVLFLNAPAFGGPAGFAGIPPATTSGTCSGFWSCSSISSRGQRLAHGARLRGAARRRVGRRGDGRELDLREARGLRDGRRHRRARRRRSTLTTHSSSTPRRSASGGRSS